MLCKEEEDHDKCHQRHRVLCLIYLDISVKKNHIWYDVVNTDIALLSYMRDRHILQGHPIKTPHSFHFEAFKDFYEV